VQQPASAPINGTISVGILAKPPSKNALKFLNKAQRLSEEGNSAKAIELLRSAPMDPAGAPYLHSRLGTEYLKSGQFLLAIPELEEAARLLPKEPAHHSNLAYAYQALGQMERAEKEARAAVDLDHSNAKAHFLLGSILLDRPSGLKEATVNLKLARREVPSARFLLAQVYFVSGQREAAKIEIDDFMSVATEAQRKVAQQWLFLHSVHPNQGSESNKVGFLIDQNH
jgi:tetratricopeptide (TPR) repeat protein